MNTTNTPADGSIPDFLKRTPAATPAPVKQAKAKAAPKAKAVKAAAPAEGKAVPKSIVPAKFKAKYAAHDGANGDKIALAFKAYTTTTNDDGRECLDVDKLIEVAKANGIDYKRYADLNNGQKRMNVGNRLRGLLKQGQTVSVGGIKFADAKKALVVQEPKAAKPAKAEAQATA